MRKVKKVSKRKNERITAEVGPHLYDRLMGSWMAAVEASTSIPRPTRSSVIRDLLTEALDARGGK